MPDAVALARLETDMMGKVMAHWPAISGTRWRASGGRSWHATREFSRSARDAEKPAPDSKHLKPHGILVDDLSAADLIELFTVLAADNAPHRHMLRIRAPTSRRTCLGSARPDAAATTIGHVVHSNNGSRVAGMNRVRAA